MNTSEIIETVKRMSDRGVEFLTVPDTYYENLRKGLAHADI
jgi:4-hydroxyphenylpyruvate dioxygenase